MFDLRSRSAAVLLAGITPWISCSYASASVVISDGTFNSANWSLVQRPYGTGGGGGSATQVLVGGAGDNGAARQTSNTAGPSNSGSYNASIYTAFTYTPSISGPLTGLNFSIDARFIDGISSIGCVVEQGGFIWLTGNAITTSGWTTHNFTPSTGADWFLINPTVPYVVVGPGPNFTASGTPMRFGFYTGNGTSAGGNTYSHTGLNDNFVVRFVPSPGAAALLGLGGLLAAKRRRRGT